MHKNISEFLTPNVILCYIQKCYNGIVNTDDNFRLVTLLKKYDAHESLSIAG